MITFENVCGLAYETSSSLKMRWNTMFITAVCVIFLTNSEFQNAQGYVKITTRRAGKGKLPKRKTSVFLGLFDSGFDLSLFILGVLSIDK